MPKLKAHDQALRSLRAFGLSYPEAHLKSPWPEHLDLAVRNKTFAFMSIEGQPFSISCKLPQSADVAIHLPFAEPTGYGLGRSGWVTAKFAPNETLPLDLLKEWIDESYRAQAPKKLVQAIAPGPGAQIESPANKKAAKKEPVDKEPAPKKSPKPRKAKR